MPSILKSEPLLPMHPVAAPMINLTRLNNQQLVVNCDLIKFVEKSPDTVITLISGEKLVVLETVEQVLERVVKFRLSIAPQPTAQWTIASRPNLEKD